MLFVSSILNKVDGRSSGLQSFVPDYLSDGRMGVQSEGILSRAPDTRCLVQISHPEQSSVPSLWVGELVTEVSGKDNAPTCSLFITYAK